MDIYKNDDQSSMFSISKNDFDQGNGRRSFAYSISVSSAGFSAALSNIWFEEEEILRFIDNLSSLTSGKKSSLIFEAMSDFKLTIHDKGGLGHFTLEFFLERQMVGNFARITIILSTQVLINFATGLKLSIQG